MISTSFNAFKPNEQSVGIKNPNLENFEISDSFSFYIERQNGIFQGVDANMRCCLN